MVHNILKQNVSDTITLWDEQTFYMYISFDNKRNRDNLPVLCKTKCNYSVHLN